MLPSFLQRVASKKTGLTLGKEQKSCAPDNAPSCSIHGNGLLANVLKGKALWLC